MLSKLFVILKAKAAITALATIALVGSATAAFAATPTGQTLVQQLTTHQPAATSTTTHPSDPGTKGNTTSQNHQGTTCPGLVEAQKLATQFHLSTAANGNAVQAMCELHMGTFKGATRTYGFGEISQLLMLAQGMDKKANSPLSDTNVSSSLAAVLQMCSSTASTMDCLRNHDPSFQPGNGSGSGDGGKPTTTPTPHPHH